MILRGRATTLPNDAPVPNDTPGEIRLLADDSLVATVETTDGWYEYTQNGNPGPFRVFFDYADVIKNQYSKITGPSGPTDIGNLPLIFRAFSNGIIDGLSGEIVVSSTGSSMTLNVAAGAGLVQGILYDQLVAGTLGPVEAAHATLARIDTVAIEVVPPGAGEDIEGRSELVIIKGTAAASPVAPTLTQTASLYQMALYDVLVGAAVTVIGSDKLTDRRSFTTANIPAGSITDAMLSTDAKSLYAVKKSGTTINVESINRLNFNGDFFDVDVNAGFAGKQIDIDFLGAGNNPLMPVSEFVATGPISSGTRTLITLGVGPLPTGVAYAVFLYAGVTVRNQVNSGTIIAKCSIDGGTERTHEFQNVGGVPRWCPVTQSAVVTKTPGASFNVVMKVSYSAADTSDIRAGWVQVIAVPYSLLTGT
jgi:hypothetical protein